MPLTFPRDVDDDRPTRDGSLPVLSVPLAPESQPQPSNAPKLIYIVLLLIPLILGSAVVLIRTGVIAGKAGSARTPWDLAVVVVGILTTGFIALQVGRRLPFLLARSKSETADAQLSMWELATTIATAPLGLMLAVLAFLLWSGALPALPALADPIMPLVVTGIAILVASTPLAYFGWARQRNIRAIEARFPDFLRDLNESYAAGMTMAQAIRVAARGDYGKLNPELRRMAHQVSWGTSFPDALRMFADRVGTPLVVRAVALINKATEAGGNVRDVLAAAARDAREIEALEADRRAGMALYVIVIYVAFAVFLAVVAALQGLLVPSLITSTQGVAGGNIGGLSVGGRLTLDDFRFIYFGVGTVQALGSGIVAGTMSEGSVAAGIKHSAIMLGIATLVLGILL